MSVVLESQAGDRLYCILAFSASPRGEPFSWDTCRSFRVGEAVTYVNWYRDEHFRDHPVGWMVLFDATDGKRYAATQSYFVTEDCWQGLKEFFTKSSRESRKRPKATGS